MSERYRNATAKASLGNTAETISIRAELMVTDFLIISLDTEHRYSEVSGVFHFSRSESPSQYHESDDLNLTI